MTTSEVAQLFGRLRFERDDRDPPDERRRGQFKAGWEDATVRGKVYAENTLQWLTWHNLGYRFTRPGFGDSQWSEQRPAFKRAFFKSRS